jgi:glycerophosphoryl diester phosphodiesterase
MALGITALLAKPIPSHPFFESAADVMVMAHRGGRYLWPENTLFAFENATALGVDVLEMDLRSTRDGAIVVLHDDTVDRTMDGSGPVLEYTLEELKSLDAAYHWSPDDGQTYPLRGQGIVIPTLEEVLAAFPDMQMNIEIKQSEPSIVASVCDLLSEHGAVERVLVASFDSDTIKAFRETCPEVASTAGESEVRLLYGLSVIYLGGLYRPQAEAVQVPEYSGGIHVVTQRFIDAAHRRGMDVHVWTVNEADDIQRMLDLGVDGIITDAPDLLLQMLGR